MIRTCIIAACVIAGLALVVATIGAVLALISGHVRWIELSWLSIAASLFAVALITFWPAKAD